MKTPLLLMLLAGVVTCSYVFNGLARRFSIPSVLLLMAVGVGLRQVMGPQIDAALSQPLLEVLGTLGLILIVLEGSLDLKITPAKRKLISSSLLAAMLVFGLTGLGLTLLMQYWSGSGFLTALINALPLAIVSSAIAIPSVAHQPENTREFITYESTLSDILGVLFFSFFVSNTVLALADVGSFLLGLLLITVVSVAASGVLIYFINHVQSKVKFFLILAILCGVYGAGKLLHLPSLLLILVFGLLLNNASGLLQRFQVRFLSAGRLEAELVQFKLVTHESAFLVRTLFFVLFGFLLDIRQMARPELLPVAGIIIVASLVARLAGLGITARSQLRTALWIFPRGLITILLFLEVPDSMKLPVLSQPLIAWVIVGTSLLMTGGLVLSRKRTVEGPSTEIPRRKRPSLRPDPAATGHLPDPDFDFGGKPVS